MWIRTRGKTFARRAFSLIEVVLALGLVSFALVAIFGVFPNALRANRISMSDSRAAHLAHAVMSMIEAQSGTFSNVQCYGQALDLTSLSSNASRNLYARYPSPEEPVISSNQEPDSIYFIELRFDNDPIVAPPDHRLGAGKLNRVQLRISGKDSSTFREFFFVARNKG